MNCNHTNIIGAKVGLFRAVSGQILGDKSPDEVTLTLEDVNSIVADLNVEMGLKAYLIGYFNVKLGG